MGRISKADLDAYKITGFRPLDLNEGNVQALFNRCVATESTTEYIKSVLYPKEFGHEQDSNPILFDKGKLLESLKQIRYLYGQLATTHKKTNTINTGKNNASPVTMNYQNDVWTDNQGVLLMFFHIGVGSCTIFPFSKNGNSMFQNVGIQPTLSPKDPGFPAWWEAHKGEWE